MHEDTINGLHVIHSTGFYSSPGLRPARVVLVKRDDDEYVTAYHCVGDSSWAWGHYFDNLTDAFDDYVDRAGKHKLGKDRASEDELRRSLEEMHEANRIRKLQSESGHD